MVIPLTEKKNVQFKPDEWGACIDSQKDKDLVIKVCGYLRFVLLFFMFNVKVKSFSAMSEVFLSLLNQF